MYIHLTQQFHADWFITLCHLHWITQGIKCLKNRDHFAHLNVSISSPVVITRKLGKWGFAVFLYYIPQCWNKIVRSLSTYTTHILPIYKCNACNLTHFMESKYTYWVLGMRQRTASIIQHLLSTFRFIFFANIYLIYCSVSCIHN